MTKPKTTTRTTNYDMLLLSDLIRRIVEERDQEALRVFHDHRTVFKLSGSRPLLFVDFVSELLKQPWARKTVGCEAASLDRAYDMAVDRFRNLPEVELPTRNQRKRIVDCRNYFGAFLNLEAEWSARNPAASILERETAAAKILQRVVVRHTRYACMEAQRNSNPARSRYAWSVGKSEITVWLPQRLSGRDREEWLEKHVENPNPKRPGECDRVQAIIDDRLGIPHAVPLDDCVACARAERAGNLEATVDREESVGIHGLDQAVADEKVQHLRDQRPAIRKLGGPKLRSLILRIFEAVIEGRYNEKAIAEEFKLSRATLSRFAGKRWRESTSDRMPDLWRNTAHVLVDSGPFTKEARRLKFWEKEMPVPSSDTPRTEENYE